MDPVRIGSAIGYQMGPSQLNVKKANQSDNLASCLDLTFTTEKDGKLSTKLYDKRDDFDSHIANFPFYQVIAVEGSLYSRR